MTEATNTTLPQSNTITNVSMPDMGRHKLTDKKKSHRHKSKKAKIHFVLNCCNLESKLPTYQSEKDKFLQSFFHKGKRKIKFLKNLKMERRNCSKMDIPSIYQLPHRRDQTQEKPKKYVFDRPNMPDLHNTRLNILKRPVILPELYTDRSRIQVDRLLKDFETKTHTDRHSVLANKTIAHTEHDRSNIANTNVNSHSIEKATIKPITRQEFLSTIEKLKSKL